MNINSLLPKNANHKRRLEVMALANKWERTGLLEGLNEYDRGNVAQLLENQAKQIVREGNRTSTQQGSEEWAGIALPLIRRIFGEITAKDFVSVQPMNLPSGLVFWLEFKYATGQPGFETGSGRWSQQDSIWGVSDATKGDPTTGGLYGEGRFGYTINDYNSTIAHVIVDGTPAEATASLQSGSINLTSDINFDSEFAAMAVKNGIADDLYRLTIHVDSLHQPDLEGIRAFTLSGGGIETQFNQFTSISPDKKHISFIVSGSGEADTDLTVYYHRQPTDTSRGDFEEGKTGDDPLDIPSLNLEFHSEEITAKTRKLKAMWTPEFAQDIDAYQNVDAEAELTGILGEYIAKEIDLEILDMLRVNAQTTNFWSARLGYEYNPATNQFDQTTANASAYNQGTWFQTLGTKIQSVSNEIDRRTFRGGANFLVCNSRVATVLESIPGYAADTDGTKSKFSFGSRKIGTLNNNFTVYKSPYMKENVILMGYRGNSYLETGAVYAPYIPLIMTPLIHDPENFTPRKGVMTRYAKKMLRPEFYGKVFVEGLDTI